MKCAEARRERDVAFAVLVHDEQVGAVHHGAGAESDPLVRRRRGDTKIDVARPLASGRFWYADAIADVCGPRRAVCSDRLCADGQGFKRYVSFAVRLSFMFSVYVSFFVSKFIFVPLTKNRSQRREWPRTRLTCHCVRFVVYQSFCVLEVRDVNVGVWVTPRVRK